jgi:hypothetical protein
MKARPPPVEGEEEEDEEEESDDDIVGPSLGDGREAVPDAM